MTFIHAINVNLNETHKYHYNSPESLFP